MSIVATSLIGRFGNQLFQYCHARALADQTGAELHTPVWIGEKIFDIPPAGRDISNPIGGYHQDQASLIYTRRQVKEWLKLKLDLESALWAVRRGGMVMHRRLGDYGALGYVVVSMKSYMDTAEAIWGGRPFCFSLVSEEDPIRVCGIPAELSFLPDFYRMMTADVLLRGNSSFSWWAATLSNAEVWSPVIEGIPGGAEERDCEFVRGNHPRFCSLEFVTDLHLEP